MKAYVVQSQGTAGLKDVPVPTIDDDEVLVQNYAAAQNPTDWQCKLPSSLQVS